MPSPACASVRRRDAAEWVLRLTASPQHATAAAAGLAEAGAGRSSWWFWKNVLSAVASCIGMEVGKSPWALLRLALWGVAANWVLGYGLLLLVSMLCRTSLKPGVSVPAVLAVSSAVWITNSVVPGLVGWAVGRRSQARELAACILLICLAAAIYGVEVSLSAWQDQWIGKPWPGIDGAGRNILIELPFFLAGAVGYRVWSRQRAVPIT